MIKLLVTFRNHVYDILYHDGALYPYEDPEDVQYKLMTYYINLWKETGYLSTGECVVCYDDNKIGTSMGCCDNKNFLCVSCIAQMYEAGRYGCPCCRENMISVMADRIGVQSDLYERKFKERDTEYSLINEYNKGRFSTFKIIKDLYEFDLPSEDQLKWWGDYDEETNTSEVEIKEHTQVFFWNKKPKIHFNKIQRKVGYKPMNMARMGGKMRTVME